MNVNQPTVTDRHYEIIAGTVLGGSSLIKAARGKHCYLSMRDRNAVWLEYKAAELKSLASDAPFTVEKTLRWHSLCYPAFDVVRGMFYEGKRRRLRIEPLDRLHDVGLAIWYGDCGSYRNGKVTLRTHLWGREGTKVIAEYFDRLGWPGKTRQERGYWRFVMTGESARRYLSRVVPQLPGFLTAAPERST